MIDVTPRAIAGALAALCALAICAALRRGTTCAIASVNELIDKRRFGRLLALIAVMLLVPCGLLLASVFDALPALPAVVPVTRTTLWGGLLLVLGMSVNGACALGTVARIGAGQWCYVATPIGYYAGCHVAARALAASPPFPVDGSSSLHASASIAVLLAAVVTTLAACALHSCRTRPTAKMDRSSQRPVAHAMCWPPIATAAIGVTFVLLFALDGAWTYGDTPSAPGQPYVSASSSRVLLLGALLLGAMSAAITRAMRGTRVSATRVMPSQLARCLGGGALMGWASVIIPGGNDSLMLMAMPLLRPYAWVAFASILFAITAVSLSRRLPGVHR
jgi:toxin CptA